MTDKPVFGPLRCSIAAALNRGDHFGMIAFTDKSKPRQRRVLQGMGVEARMVASIALNLGMEVLTDRVAPPARLVEAVLGPAVCRAATSISDCIDRGRDRFKVE